MSAPFAPIEEALEDIRAGRMVVVCDAEEIDEIRLFLAPLLLGGSSARDPLEGGGVEHISEAVRTLTFECERVGEDILVSARLREW